MSDYFGALMRSSGLSVGAQSPTPALGRVEAGVVEVEVERSAAVVASAVAPAASTPQPASASAFDAHPASALAPPAVPAPEPAADVLPLVQARLTTPLSAEPGVAASAAADPLLPPAATAAAEPPNPPLGQTLVRAAMQWVVADPMQPRSSARVVPPSSSSGEAITAPGRSVAPARPLREAASESESDAQGRTALAHPAALPEPSPREPVHAPALATRPARPLPMAPPALPQPLAHDELIEVSIGAIHLRVDAPAAQTIARPAPAPAAAPRAPALAPRSALSRRALRRI